MNVQAIRCRSQVLRCCCAWSRSRRSTGTREPIRTSYTFQDTWTEKLRESATGRVSRVSPVQTAVRNCTRDEGGPFEVGSQVLISSHRKLLLSKPMVVSVAETPGQDFGRQG